MIVYQNLAYCRFLFLWSFLYVFDIVKFSPLITLLIVIIIELNMDKYYMNRNKRYGIIISEIYLVIMLILKNRKLYLIENTIAIMLYCGILLLMETNIIKLYNNQLLVDDRIYSEETYWNYLARTWYSFFYQLVFIGNLGGNFSGDINEKLGS